MHALKLVIAGLLTATLLATLAPSATAELTVDPPKCAFDLPRGIDCSGGEAATQPIVIGAPVGVVCIDRSLDTGSIGPGAGASLDTEACAGSSDGHSVEARHRYVGKVTLLR
jgi:hypothetical protein